MSVLQPKHADYYYVPGSHRMAPLDTEAGYMSARTTMTLMQMIADIYGKAREEWKTNADREIVEGVDDPEHFGPINEAQLAVEGWLVHAHFLPPRERYRSEVKKLTDNLKTDDLLTSTEVTPMVKKETSKTLEVRRILSKQIFAIMKFKNINIPSLSLMKVLKQLRTKNLPKSVLVPPLIPTVETQSTSPLEALNPIANSIPSKSKSPRSYRPRPRFSLPARLRTLSLEQEQERMTVEHKRPPLPKRSATFPSYFQQTNIPTGQYASGIESELVPLPAKRHTYNMAQDSCEIERRKIIASNEAEDNTRQEITVGTLLLITILGYVSFLLLLLACFIIGLKRLMDRSVSSLTFLLNGIDTDV